MNHWPVSKCRGQGTFAEVNKVTVEGIVPLLAFLIMGVTAAFGILVTEIICERHNERKRKKALASLSRDL